MLRPIACGFVILGACTTPATEVAITLGTDAPPDRVLRITLTAHSGANEQSDGGVWTATRGAVDGGVLLPGSIAITPRAGQSTHGDVTVVVDATLDARSAAEPELHFRRIARFAFTPHATTLVPLFLAVSCGTPATGCMNVPASQCTLSARCEDQGQTCGDNGSCVAVDVQPQPSLDGSVTITDVGPTPSVDANDVMSDGGAAVLRQIAPMSGARITSHRPTFRWHATTGSSDVQIELSRVSTFATVANTFPGSAGSAPLVGGDLTSGVWYWRIHPRAGSVVSTDSSPIWRFDVPLNASPVDAESGLVTDFDRDGYADIAIGDPLFNGGRGRVWVYRGSATGIGTMGAITIDGPTSSMPAHFGCSVANAGDVNGDGYSDLVVGADGAIDGTGAAYLYPGSANAVSSFVTWVNQGRLVGDLMGYSVASGGDMDGDGTSEVIVGAPGANSGAGLVLVSWGDPSVHGGRPFEQFSCATGVTRCGQGVAGGTDVSADGLSEAGVWAIASDHTVQGALLRWSGTLLSNLVFPTAGMTPNALAGSTGTRSAIAMGDFNNDGLGDVVLGAPGGDATGALPGSGIVLEFDGVAGSLSNMVRGHGTATPGASLGDSLASLGDLDGDGFGDVGSGAPGTNMGAGHVHIFPGASGGLANEIYVGTADGPGANFGRAVAGGDVNGDGRDDLIVGEPGNGGGDGTVDIYAGPVTATSSPTWSLMNPGTGTHTNFGAAVATLTRAFETARNARLSRWWDVALYQAD